MKFRLWFCASACFVLVLAVAPLSYADRAWDFYLGLNPTQKTQYKRAEYDHKKTVEEAKKDRETTVENLASQVLANAGDTTLQPVLTQVLEGNKTLDNAEEVFWRTISGFLSPIQVAKIFLKWHQPKNPTSLPPAAPKLAVQNPAPPFNWSSYFGFSKDLQSQLKTADQARNNQMKSDKVTFETTLAQLSQQVQSNAGDSPIQMTLTGLFSTQDDQHHTEQIFWGTTLPDFLSPTQEARLYLHRHPPKGGFNPPVQVVPATSPSH